MIYALSGFLSEIFAQPKCKSIPYEILKELSKKNKDQGKLLIMFIRAIQLISVFLLGCSLIFRDQIIFSRDIPIYLASILLSATFSYASEFVVRPSIKDSFEIKRIGVFLVIIDLFLLCAWIFSSVMFAEQDLVFDLILGIFIYFNFI
jgi:hypothetical protein